MRLRALTADDWRDWRALRLQALRLDPAAFGSKLCDWQDADEARWRARLQISGALDLLAERDGAPVGMASGIPAEDPDVRELISMWVAPDARGMGVGDALVSAIADWARASGARALELAVVTDNAAAIRLYERHGFLPVPGPPGPEARMLLRLQA